MSRANEENNEFDDIFTKPDDSNGDDDFFASLNGSQSADDDSPFADFDGSEPSDASPSPWSTPDDSFSGIAEFSESKSLEATEGEPLESFGAPTDAPAGDADGGDFFASLNGSQGDDADSPFADFGGSEPSDAPTDVPAGKKGKKAKKEKAPKAPKAKKEKKEKAPKNVALFGSPKPFLLLGAIFLVGILAANVVAFATAGGGAMMFLACFDLLGLILLAIPALLIKQLKTRAVGLFDVFLALVAAFVTISAMTLLAYQAKTYGPSSKVASTVAVSTFADRA